MAGNTSTAKSGETVAPEAAGDRIAMASVRADGTLDQHNPEFLDEEFARASTRVQLEQAAVSAVDDRERRAAAAEAGSAEKVDQDPSIAKREKAHEAAAEKGRKAADSLVDALKPDEKSDKS